MRTEKNFLNFLLAIIITLLTSTSNSIAAGLETCLYPGTCAPPSDAKNCHRCQDGFVKDPDDDTRCKYANGNASLIISSPGNIKMISLDGLNTTQMIQTGESAYGIDYNFRTNTVFWFSHKDKKMYSAPINGESGKKSIFYDSSSDIYGVAVDWIHQHLYWVDNGRNELCVSNFNGTMKKVLFLFNHRIVYPRSIAVDPVNGWMYWSDVAKGRIERAGLDGSQREVIVSGNIRDPEGLVVDYVDNRLYYKQGYDSAASIWSSRFDGSDRKLIFNFKYTVLTKIATYSKYIYFLEWRSRAIYKVNKCNGEELTLIYKSNPDIRGYLPDFLMDIKIHDASLQPDGENICSKRLDQCSHFCFPVPTQGNGSALTTTCACPDGLSLSADQQNCG